MIDEEIRLFFKESIQEAASQGAIQGIKAYKLAIEKEKDSLLQLIDRLDLSQETKALAYEMHFRNLPPNYIKRYLLSRAEPAGTA